MHAAAADAINCQSLIGVRRGHIAALREGLPLESQENGRHEIFHRYETVGLGAQTGLDPDAAPGHAKERQCGAVAWTENHRRSQDRYRTVRKLAADGLFHGKLGFAIPRDRRVGVGFGSRCFGLGCRSTGGLRRNDNRSALLGQCAKGGQCPIDIGAKVVASRALKEDTRAKDGVFRRDLRPLRRNRGENMKSLRVLFFKSQLLAQLVGTANGRINLTTLAPRAQENIAAQKSRWPP